MIFIFSLVGAERILRAISLLFLSNYSQSFIPAVKFMPFQLYLSIKCLIFDILSGFQFLDDLMQQLLRIEKTLSLVFLGFIVAFLQDIHSGDFMYELHLFNFML